MKMYSESQAATLAGLYHRLIEDPGSLDEQWQGFFADLDDQAKAVIEKLNGRAPGAAAAVAAAARPLQPVAGQASVHDPAVRVATLAALPALLPPRAARSPRPP